LFRLRNSINHEQLCHEECRLRRNFWRQEIINSLKQGNNQLNRKIKKYFLTESESREFKKELLEIIQEVDNQAEYLLDYLKSSQTDSEIKTAIVVYLIKNNKDINFYFSLLVGNYAIAIKEEVLRVISNLKNKKQLFTIKQLNWIEEIIFSQDIDDHFCSSLVLLLGDYYDLFPQETKILLDKIYQSQSEIDQISRFFAADLLTSKTGRQDWPEPPIKDQDWGDYFNN